MTERLMHDQASSLVRERDRRRLRAMGAALALGGLLVGGVLGYVWLQVQRVRVSYELEDLRALRGDVEEQNRKLRLEMSSLRSFARVESEARRLGLTEPARDQVRLAREFFTGSGSRELAAGETGLRTAASTTSDAGAARATGR
jgi:cell division protein FtsL